MVALGGPAEVDARLIARRRLGFRHRRVVHLERTARHLEGDLVHIGVGGRDGEVDLRPCQHTGVVDGSDLGQLVVAGVHQHLHVADDGADLDPVTPFLDEDGQVVFPLQDGVLPLQQARHRVDLEEARRLGIGVAWDVLAAGALARHQAVAQAVAVGVECAGVVVERLAHTALIHRGVEQLHRVVGPQEGVDHQLGLDIHGHTHRIGHVDHAIVAVGILHADDVGACGGVGMHHLIDVERVVVAEVLHHQTGHHVGEAVAPQHGQRVALQPGGTGRIGIAGELELVAVAAQAPVGDFRGTLVRCPQRQHATQQQSE